MKQFLSGGPTPRIGQPLLAAMLLLILLLSNSRAPALVAEVALASEDSRAMVQPAPQNVELDVFFASPDGQLFSREDGTGFVLPAGEEVSIRCGASVVTTQSRAETVSQLLDRMSVVPSPLEMVRVTLGGDGIALDVSGEHIFYESLTTTLAHETQYVYNSDRPDWYEAELIPGMDGERVGLYEVLYQDGEEIARQLIDKTDIPPTDALVEVGTRENFASHKDAVADITVNEDGSGVITLENGHTVTFREKRTMKGTAYSALEDGVGTTTASGTEVRPGVVAVNRKDIPLGSKLYVVSDDGEYVYGFSLAEDTGVRSGVIDLYIESIEACYEFGVRQCSVYILD